MNPAHTHDARAMAVVHNVTRRFTRFALSAVRAYVEDAGGEWTEALSDTAREAVSEFLRSPLCAPVIVYHSYAETTPDLWRGSADAALNRAARRTANRIGMPMMNRAARAGFEAVCRTLGEDSGVTANMRARDGRDPGEGSRQVV